MDVVIYHIIFQLDTDARDLRIVFCVRIESAVRFDFESNFRIESAVYTTQAVTPSNELHRYLFCICHEPE